MPKTAVPSFFDIPTPLQFGKEANCLQYCWFVAKQIKLFPLSWELNSFFMQFLLKEFCCLSTKMAILSLGCKPRISQLHDVTIDLDSTWAVLVFLKALVF